MVNPWLARFAGAPALVAPHMRDRFEASLTALAARFDTELAAQQDGGDDFWTELGPYASRRLRPYNVVNGILELPVRGVLLHGFPYQFLDWATGYEYIWKAFDRGLGDDAVKGIALIIDSPGGMVAGNFDLVDRMFAARGIKPVRAYASEYAYSAAYSIASAADSITLPRTGDVGSIGVVTTHLDVSKAYEEIGFKVTFIFAGKHKVDGNAYEPLPDDVKASIQADIDYLYGIFVDTVARNRGLDPNTVRATEANTFRADEALEAGLADFVGPLDNALADFAADLTNPAGDDTVSDQKATVTVASVKADHPDVATALINEGREAAQATAKTTTETAVATALTAERGRVAKLDGFARTYGGNANALKIIDGAKADGSKPEDVAMQLIESGASAAAGVVAGMEGDDAGATGARPAGLGGTPAAAQTPDGWSAEWKGSDKLQAEFPTEGAYVAFKKDEQRRKGGR
ncbi:S49 family peptidase [Reyranella sp.]|jgi:signal peptide peptidase SppA|nr:S49 family peptidase [Reyranella sp.]OYY40512.1 MAG: hypothetical protein B7Y57_17540 [Rhodospirillales bacterium 35-66-84]OYZ93129.1 MAG: hypothetical protein B7Y08_18790 [Rhodospirillales bacterium 24-66-33]OZB24257.1 MAG: hypothetical protein B7X63_16750 [Rhodospirillales bacterium 39-66-50]HQT14833.1 S49 family peptidase [Reyranella sp.]